MRFTVGGGVSQESIDDFEDKTEWKTNNASGFCSSSFGCCVNKLFGFGAALEVRNPAKNVFGSTYMQHCFLVASMARYTTK